MELSSFDLVTAEQQMRDVLADGGDGGAVYLFDALEAGRVEGAFYYGVCACLIGTVAIGAGRVPADYEESPYSVWSPNNAIVSTEAERLAERWYGDASQACDTEVEKVFGLIHSGDTPDTNHASAWAVGVVERWIAERAAAMTAEAVEVSCVR